MRGLVLFLSVLLTAALPSSAHLDTSAVIVFHDTITSDQETGAITGEGEMRIAGNLEGVPTLAEYACETQAHGDAGLNGSFGGTVACNLTASHAGAPPEAVVAEFTGSHLLLEVALSGHVRGHVFVCRGAFVPVAGLGERYVTAEELDVCTLE